MTDLKYTTDHEWMLVEDNIVTVGITDFAQEQLGDVVYVELPEVDSELCAGEQAAVIESVKAAGEIKSPIKGVVAVINEALQDKPEILNEDPTGSGWIFKLEINDQIDFNEFMDNDAYDRFIEEC